jgi:hypothetical protein
LPAWEDVFIVLSAILVAVFSWSIRGFLFVFPSILMRYATTEIIAVFSYMMAFALVESFLLLVGLVFVSTILPRMWLREGFSYKGFLVVLVGSIASIQYHTFLGKELPEVNGIFLWTGIIISILVGLCLLFHYIHRLQVVLISIAERFTVFAYIYIPLGFLCLAVVIFRNLFKG